MKKSIYLFTLVGFLFLTGLVETISGFVLWFALPSGGGKKSLELTYWGLTRHTWIDIHDWVAIAMIVIMIIHFLLHWKWVCRMVKHIFVQFKEAYKTIQTQLKADTGQKQAR
jgi:hypothetical protein